MTHTTLLLPPNVGVLEAPPSSDQPPHGSEGDGSLNRGASGGEGKADGGARGGRGGSGGSEQDSEDLSMGERSLLAGRSVGACRAQPRPGGCCAAPPHTRTCTAAAPCSR